MLTPSAVFFFRADFSCCSLTTTSFFRCRCHLVSVLPAPSGIAAIVEPDLMPLMPARLPVQNESLCDLTLSAHTLQSDPLLPRLAVPGSDPVPDKVLLPADIPDRRGHQVQLQYNPALLLPASTVPGSRGRQWRARCRSCAGWPHIAGDHQ